MDRAHILLPDTVEDLLDVAIATVAPGTPLREALDMVIAAENGALICVGDVDTVLSIGNGGFHINAPFTPQRLFELSKMDGAIILSDDLSTIICANFHLNPDPSIITQETGMRHRTAERTSSETDAVIIAISKRRKLTTVYHRGDGLIMDSDEILFSKANQGIVALQNAKANLERLVMRQSFIELDDIVTAADVSAILVRYANLIRLAALTERYINFLGTSSGLLRNQLQEIMRGVADALLLIIRDYTRDGSNEAAIDVARSLLTVPSDELDTAHIMGLLGFSEDISDESHLSARGFRVISRISMLDEQATQRIVDEYGSLANLVMDSEDGFNRLSEAGVNNVRAIAASFRQLRSTL